jgi:hypothetical protein
LNKEKKGTVYRAKGGDGVFKDVLIIMLCMLPLNDIEKEIKMLHVKKRKNLVLRILFEI